ncbi:MAG TPA: carbon monoxide dehydrogenase [Candidatus Omnitrophica bacterium]|nr:carbon monoxide dehydrogenase [Candidatus Omnitrophota bacterium]
MSDVIVIAGKGGTGKTTVSALITLMLAKRRAGAVLAVDADPNSNLSDALGLSEVGTIADIIEEVARSPETVPQSMGKDSFIEYKIHNDISENDGFDLLVMGRPEGPGCYCYINNVLRNVMAKLISEYGFSVIDNEAGLEHFSRKTTRAAGELIVVSDESQVGLRSAERIIALIDELGIAAKKRFLVVNRQQTPLDPQTVKTKFAVDDVFMVPFDKEVLDLSSKGSPLSGLSESSKARLAIEAMGDRIWPKN